MPHIAIEVSPSLLPSIQWEPVLHAMHLALAERGWARLADLKSRVAPIAVGLCGDDPHAQQLIATLTLTNPRPRSEEHTSELQSQSNLVCRLLLEKKKKKNKKQHTTNNKSNKVRTT